MFYTFSIFSCTLHPFPLKMYLFFMRVGGSSGCYFTFQLIILSFLKLFILIAVVVSVRSGVSLIINRLHRGHHSLLYFIVRGFKDVRVLPPNPLLAKDHQAFGRWEMNGDLMPSQRRFNIRPVLLFFFGFGGMRDHNLTLHLKACQICQVNWW